MNLASIVNFIRQLDAKFKSDPTNILLYSVEDGKRELTNGVFLLGAFMIMCRNASVNDVQQSFRQIPASMITAYRDATFAEPCFGLTLEDCWQAIVKGIQLGWINAPESVQDYQWGCVDMDKYVHYDDPINGNLHEVVPGKFIAFPGPIDIGEALYRDEELGVRTFSPDYWADILHNMGVTDVVQLNESRYEKRCFTQRGMQFHELGFEDCTAPPLTIVDAFLCLADAAPGIVAVHCKAGLGRTGTLIAVYLMRRHGFTPREAMAWLRIMRPGSVIGEQQHFLCAEATDTLVAAAGTACEERLSVAVCEKRLGAAVDVETGMWRRAKQKARRI